MVDMEKPVWTSLVCLGCGESWKITVRKPQVIPTLLWSVLNDKYTVKLTR